MKQKHLFYLAALIWGIPALIVTAKGTEAYTHIASHNLWWLLLISVGVFAAFTLMFRGIVNRYSARIDSLDGRLHLWQTFPLRGWILILFMMGLGMMLRFVPNIPLEFTASFYSGLGPALIVAAIRFATRARRG